MLARYAERDAAASAVSELGLVLSLNENVSTAHQSPASFVEVRHHVATASLAVASLRRYLLMDSATI
jgi:hypothetical protein